MILLIDDMVQRQLHQFWQLGQMQGTIAMRSFHPVNKLRNYI